MPSRPQILSPTDLSASSSIAVRYCFELARALEADVLLLYTYTFPGPPTPGAFYPAASRAIYEQSKADLAQLATQCGGHDVATQFFVRTGHPAASIVELAREHAVDMIVMGSHRLHGVERMLVGSVAETVARNAACPVFVIPTLRQTEETPSSLRRHP